VGIPAALDFRDATTLGLRLVCILTEQLRGTIQLDGRRHAVRRDLRARGSGMNVERKRIFIVEDQRLIAADLDNTLSRLGYLVVGSAASGNEALEMTTALQPDLVLMDIRLQGRMDGIEAAAAIRERLDVPVCYLTAYADEETIDRAKRAAPFGYLVKPFNQRELRAGIEIALYKHEADTVLAREERGGKRQKRSGCWWTA
jgi:CheY-like chemotaxis protein